MVEAAIYPDDDHIRFVEHVYEKQHARLLRYFWVQLGDISEAEDCIQETIYRFFLLMVGRCWSNEMEYISVRLMKLAAILCMEKLAETKLQDVDSLDDSEHPDGFNKIRDAAICSIKERLRVTQLSQITRTGRGQLSMTL